MPTLALVHTVRRVIGPLAELTTELLPEVSQLHYLDESTLKDAVSEGGLTPDITRRVCTLLMLVAERADAVLVTCSSIGPCVPLAAAMADVPILRIDRPMAEAAVAGGASIGVIADSGHDANPTAELIAAAAAAAEAGRKVTIRRLLVEGAFAAASAGDAGEHDRLVLQGLWELLQPPDPVDVIVLAQASMTAVAAQLPPDLKTPILSSPRSGIIRAGEALTGL